MRSIQVSTDVFATIWSLRRAGEDSEDVILARVLTSAGLQPNPESPTNSGILDARSGTLFPEGLEIFRTYLGVFYKAKVIGGVWVLENNNRTFRTLAEISKGIGAKTENAWANWHYYDKSGARKTVSDLRDPTKISIRSRPQGHLPRNGTKTSQIGDQQLDSVIDSTWRDDVVAALRKLGGCAPLSSIYEETKAIRAAAGRSTPPTFDAIVRRTLEDNSSDSQNFKGRDLFRMPLGKGSGVWELR